MTRLTLTTEPPLRLALDGLLPERLGRLPAAEIERMPLALGNQRSSVGDWFRVEAGGEASRLEIVGSCRRIDRIGAGMTGGSLVVRGDAGAYLGLGMSGGTLTVDGTAGFGAATALAGGLMRIGGDAGDGIGGALPGAASGMRDGVVIVAGAAGAAAGARLRRGLIVIEGAAGPGCGTAMIAGTIVVAGALGDNAGAAMRRGSIIALSGAPRLGPGFADFGVHDFVFLRLLARELVALGLADLATRIGTLRRFGGDGAVSGRGEVLTGK